MKKRLADVKSGTVVVRVPDGGGGMQAHLAGMKIVSGMKVVVLRNRGKGPIVVGIQHTRIAIGRKMAETILVEESGDE